MSTPSKLAHHFRFHPCLCPEDFLAAQHDEGYSALFVHHFINPSIKPIWPNDFRIHICYIPTTFETYAFTMGTEPLSEFGSEWVLSLLATRQEFPGSFVESDIAFLSLLSTLITNIPIAGTRMIAFADTPIEPQSKKYKVDETVPVDPFKEVRPCPYTAIPGAVIGQGDIEFLGGRGENRFWVAEVATPIKPDSSSGFGRLHRRIEWFMHFYIDALSPVDLESRWRVFIIFRFFTDPSPLTVINDDIVKHIQQSQTVVKNDDPLDHTVPLTSMYPGMMKLQKDELLSEVITNPNQPMEILGLITAFQFFSIPKDRVRISQFFLFPNRQRQGLGRLVLHVLMETLTSDTNVQQVSVEDPAPVFQRLRDCVSVERAIKRGLISLDCLYPPEETGKNNTSIVENWKKYDDVFKRILLETKQQRRRLKLLLTLAQLLPTGLLQSSETLDWRQFEKSHPLISRCRIREKQKLRRDSLDWYTQPNMDLRTVQGALEEEWSQLFLSLCFTVRKLRAHYPSMPPETVRVGE